MRSILEELFYGNIFSRCCFLIENGKICPFDLDCEIGSIARGKTADLDFVNDLFHVNRVMLSGAFYDI